MKVIKFGKVELGDRNDQEIKPFFFNPNHLDNIKVGL